jgi:hypothetical protein
MTVITKLPPAFRYSGHNSSGIVTLLRTARFMACRAEEFLTLALGAAVAKKCDSALRRRL